MNVTQQLEDKAGGTESQEMRDTIYTDPVGS